MFRLCCGMAFKIPESVLVVVHTPRLDVLLLERTGTGLWQSVTGSRELGRPGPRGDGAPRAAGGDRPGGRHADRLAADQPLRDLGAMAGALRAGRHPQCRACLRLPGARSRPWRRSIRPSMSPSSGCPGRRPWRRSSRPRTGTRSGSCSVAAQFVDMWCTCDYLFHMPTMIQIRNVPDTLHRRLKSRAALAGMSLSDYLLQQIREVAERPTIEELRARLARRSSVALSVDTADAVRAERESR